MSRFSQYKHHGNEVWVQTHLKGRHRSSCLCWQGCEHFKPDDRENNCPIAKDVLKKCIEFKIVLPVWECINFSPTESEEEPPPEWADDIAKIIGKGVQQANKLADEAKKKVEKIINIGKAMK